MVENEKLNLTLPFGQPEAHASDDVHKVKQAGSGSLGVKFMLLYAANSRVAKLWLLQIVFFLNKANLSKDSLLDMCLNYLVN